MHVLNTYAVNTLKCSHELIQLIKKQEIWNESLFNNEI